MQLEYISAFLITLVVTLLVMPGVIRFYIRSSSARPNARKGLPHTR